jgi:hypothetical protein
LALVDQQPQFVPELCVLAPDLVGGRGRTSVLLGVALPQGYVLVVRRELRVSRLPL